MVTIHRVDDLHGQIRACAAEWQNIDRALKFAYTDFDKQLFLPRKIRRMHIRKLSKSISPQSFPMQDLNATSLWIIKLALQSFRVSRGAAPEVARLFNSYSDSFHHAFAARR